MFNPHTLAQGCLIALSCFILGISSARLVEVAGALADRRNVPRSINNDATPAETLSVPQPARAAKQPAGNQDAGRKEVMAGGIFSDKEELTYNGYVVQKRYKKVKDDYPPACKELSTRVEVSYAVLKRRGEILARFDGGIYFGLGNDTRFGLFPLLGGNAKQLIISQDIFRGGVQWIVSLSPHFSVIYDGVKFGAGREGDDMGIVDLDHDGIYEITQPVTAFYGFSEWLPTGSTPLPLVIFKYDSRAGSYLPANRLFQDYLLKDVEDAKKNVSGPEDRIRHLSDILPIVLDYVFAGREQEAWAFYETAYKLPDKVEVKNKIKAILNDQPVYRFMYLKSAKG